MLAADALQSNLEGALGLLRGDSRVACTDMAASSLVPALLWHGKFAPPFCSGGSEAVANKLSRMSVAVIPPQTIETEWSFDGIPLR